MCVCARARAREVLCENVNGVIVCMLCVCVCVRAPVYVCARVCYPVSPVVWIRSIYGHNRTKFHFFDLLSPSHLFPVGFDVAVGVDVFGQSKVVSRVTWSALGSSTRLIPCSVSGILFFASVWTTQSSAYGKGTTDCERSCSRDYDFGKL